jgi:outer membrane protein assembly factor BamB
MVRSLRTDGTIKWTRDDLFAPSPADHAYNVPSLSSDGSKLFIATDSGRVICFRASDGFKLWERTLVGAPRIRSAVSLTSSAQSNPLAFVLANDGKVHGLRQTDGVVVWSTSIPHTSSDSPPLDPVDLLSPTPVIGKDGLLYCGGHGGYVVCLNPASGSFSWQVELPEADLIETAPAVSTSGVLYFATWAAKLFAIDPARRNPGAPAGNAAETLLWQQPASLYYFGQESLVRTSPVLDNEGNVFVATYSYGLNKVDALTGASKGTKTTWGKNCMTPMLDRAGRILFGSYDRFMAHDTTSLNEMWRFPADGQAGIGVFAGSPAVGCDGAIYFADMGTFGYSPAVFKLAGGSGPLASAWPGLLRGNRHTGNWAAHQWNEDRVCIEVLPGYYLPSGSSTVTAYLINGQGVVAGRAYGYFGGSYGWYPAVWRDGRIINPLGAGVPDGYAYGRRLNRAGDLFGSRTGEYAIMWENVLGSDPVQVPLLVATYTVTQGFDVNDSRTAIGYGYKPASGGQPAKTDVIRWQRGTEEWFSISLGSGPGNTAYPQALSPDGRIVGKFKASTAVNAPYHAFRTPPTPVNLLAANIGTLSGDPAHNSAAWDVNVSGDAVGESRTYAGYNRAFFIPVSASTLQYTHELPGLGGANSVAYGLNSQRSIVGSAQNSSGTWRAVLSRPTATWWSILDLNQRLPAGSGWSLTSASSINEAGVMVVYGSYYGVTSFGIVYPTP